MGLPQPQPHYTVEDYMQWPDEIRCELISGEIWDMSPAPTVEHQELVSNLHVEIALFLREQEKSGGAVASRHAVFWNRPWTLSLPSIPWCSPTSSWCATPPSWPTARMCRARPTWWWKCFPRPRRPRISGKRKPCTSAPACPSI